MKLSVLPFSLRLKRPFQIANYIRSETPVVFVKIQHEGFTGFGEASMPPYLKENLQTAQSFLSGVHFDDFRGPVDVNKILGDVEKSAPGNYAAKAAVDLALYDLWGKISGQPVWRLLDADPARVPLTSFTLGIDEPDVVRQKALEAGAFKILKIKLGGSKDKEMIEAVHSATDKPLFIDANQGWADEEQALDMICWLKERGAVLIEQPLPKDRLDDSAWLKEQNILPIIADESFQRLNDLPRIGYAFDGINIKLMKCGGIHEARRIIIQARKLNLSILMGSMTESSCGIMAGAALSPFCDWADLDGPWLVGNNPFMAPSLSGGKITLSELPGLGLTLQSESTDLFWTA